MTVQVDEARLLALEENCVRKLAQRDEALHNAHTELDYLRGEVERLRNRLAQYDRERALSGVMP